MIFFRTKWLPVFCKVEGNRTLFLCALKMEEIKGKKRRRKKEERIKTTNKTPKQEKRREKNKFRIIIRINLYPATENLKQCIKEMLQSTHTHHTEALITALEKSTGMYKNRQVHCDQHVPRRTINTTTVKTYIKNWRRSLTVGLLTMSDDGPIMKNY